ncbi:hypothetical protein Tco_1419507 [Tanacetum coccineum]
MAFEGNTRDLGSFGEETDKITDLHQNLEEVLLTECGDGVAGIKRRRHDPSSDGVRDLVTASGRDEKPIRTLGDYSKPSHEGYKNTIELPVGNNLNLALYDHEGWNDTKEFAKPVKAISIPQGTSKTPDRRLLELEDQINFLLKGSRPAPTPSSTHIPQDYVEAVYSNSRSQNQNEPPKLNLFGFRECTCPNPQPQALGTTFEDRVRDYMAAHTERMKRFENAIFKQREEINGRMTEMFELLKELTTSRAPEKVLIREEAKSLVTKSVKSISLIREEEEKNDIYDVATDNDSKETDKPDMKVPIKEARTKNGAENGAENKPIKKAEKEEVVETPSSWPVEYYLKHRINEKLIEGLVDNNRFNDSLSGARVGKEDEKRPFILGTPFLTTAKVVIDFDKGTITPRSGKSKISFHRILDSPCMIEIGVKNDIEHIAPTMTVNRLVLEWEEMIKLHLEREMEFNQ